MAKKEAGEKGGKTNLYLLAIVAIVAIVGIVVLILNSGSSGISLSSDDLSGQAIKKTSCDPPCTGGKKCTASGCQFPSGLSSSDISTQTTASVDGEDACTICPGGLICCSLPNSCHGGSCY